jgi:hypothetical protein
MNRGSIRSRENPKSQAPNPKEIPISNDQKGCVAVGCFFVLKFGFRELFGIWDLELGISSVAG